MPDSSLLGNSLNMQRNINSNLPKHQLPNLLKAILLRRSALVFQKLILYESAPENLLPVRHYDYDCEGLEVLVGFFKKKKQALLMKAFNRIKIAPFLSGKQRLPFTQRKQPNGTTRRTNVNSTYIGSEGTPIKIALSTLRERGHVSDLSAVPESSKKLHDLLSRVKAVNISSAGESERMRVEDLPVNRNNSSYFPTYGRMDSNGGDISYRENTSHYYAYNLSQRSCRHSRRQFILEKFRRIENGVMELQEEGEGMGDDIREELVLLRQRLNTRAIQRSVKA